MVANVAPIFVVEDNPDDIEMTLRVFRKCGVMMDIVIARDGSEALSRLETSGPADKNGNDTLPAVMFVDINMPKIGGLQVLRAIRRNPRTRHVPVVILSTSDDQGDLISGYDLGANGYIQKPLDAATFLKTMERLGLRAAMQSQGRP